LFTESDGNIFPFTYYTATHFNRMVPLLQHCVIGLWVATTPLLMLSIDTGNSPVQQAVDIFSSPFNAGGAVLLDMIVR